MTICPIGSTSRKCNSGDSGIQVELDNDVDQHLLLQQLHPLEHHHPAGVDAGRNGVSREYKVEC